MRFAGALLLQLASSSTSMPRVVEEVALKLRVVVDVVTLSCSKPSDQMMVHGAVPVSVMGIVMLCGPQTAKFAGTVAPGGAVTLTDFEAVPEQPPAVFSVRCRVTEELVAGAENVMALVPAPPVIVP